MHLLLIVGYLTNVVECCMQELRVSFLIRNVLYWAVKFRRCSGIYGPIIGILLVISKLTYKTLKNKNIREILWAVWLEILYTATKLCTLKGILQDSL